MYPYRGASHTYLHKHVYTDAHTSGIFGGASPLPSAHTVSLTHPDNLPGPITVCTACGFSPQREGPGFVPQSPDLGLLLEAQRGQETAQ
jgi:hypothetical protein